MKAERIQSQISDLPGWHTQASLVAERLLRFPSLHDACLFASRVAQKVEEASMMGVPQVDIRGGEVTLRLVAEHPEVLDAEVALIDRLVPLAEIAAGYDDLDDRPEAV